MISKIKKYLTGEFIDELFNNNSFNDSNMGKIERKRKAKVRAQVAKSKNQNKNDDIKCPYKVERFIEGDCV